MEPLFESRSNLVGFSGRLRYAQQRPTIHPEPVVLPDTGIDRRGALVYGSVFNEGGVLRMWYQAVPEEWDHATDVAGVAYAESHDGVVWRKPALGIVDHPSGPNNLTSLSLHAPAIFKDPASPADQRYRATGCIKPGHALVKEHHQQPGIYVAQSADGLNWTMGSRPTWRYTGDVSSSVYHPGRGEAVVAMKYMPRRNGLTRRSIRVASLRGSDVGESVPALVPDEYSDIAAMQRGGVSADYYGMGMLPAGRDGIVGFLWHYWHTMPYAPGPEDRRTVGLYGYADITLVYQEQKFGPWLHAPGRPGFIERRDVPGRCEWVYSSSSPVEVGDEHRLYFTAFAYSHARHLTPEWKPDPNIVAETKGAGIGYITFASWPKWRMCGLFADPHGSVTIDLGRIDRPHRLMLNYQGYANGRVRAAVVDDAQRTLDTSATLTGDSLASPLKWRDSEVIPPGENVRVMIEAHDATLYAYELVPLS